jgi:hypothetical protein
MTDEQEEDFRMIGALIKKYALVNGKPFAVLSGDLAGMTYVGRWVRTNSITDWPEDASWADVVEADQPIKSLATGDLPAIKVEDLGKIKK